MKLRDRDVSPSVRVVELPGNYAPTEIDSNALRSELEGHELAKPRVTFIRKYNTSHCF